MSLSNLVKYPSKRIKLPQSKKILNIRPFTGKDQKNLKYGLEGQNKATIASSLKKVLSSCIEEKINIGKLSTPDLEYLFIQITIISSGPTIQTAYICENEVEGVKCGNHIEVEYDLEQIQFDLSEDHDAKYKDFDVIEGMVVRFRKNMNTKIFDYFAEAMTGAKEEDLDRAEEDILINALDKVFTNEEEIDASNYPREEKLHFLESLKGSLLKEIVSFVVDSNEGYIEKEFTCGKCGFKHEMVIRGIENFLD